MEEDPFIDDIDMFLASSNQSNINVPIYDWLADSASTHHISNRHELFHTFEPTPGATVHGVGGKTSQIMGCEEISLNAQCRSQNRTLNLNNVNYIPSNKYNIIALGRWVTDGRKCSMSDDVVTLYNRHGTPILKGPKVASNMYKFTLTPNTTINTTKFTFTSENNNQNWESWHRRFGHVSYKGLKRLYDDKLVDGFAVDKDSPTPACISCIEAKQSTKPFNKTKSEKMPTIKGELTHIDLWGKYDITSINGNQYYILFIDDAT